MVWLLVKVKESGSWSPWSGKEDFKQNSRMTQTKVDLKSVDLGQRGGGGGIWLGRDYEQMVFKHTHAESVEDFVRNSTESVLLSSPCYDSYSLQLEYGSAPWHQCGQAAPSVQHE